MTASSRTAGTPGRRRLLSLATGAGVGLAGAALAGGREPARAGAGAQASVPGLVGAWLVYVPQADGTTYTAVQYFLADGGTITQFRAASGEFGASLGAGVWTQSGPRDFALTFTAAEYNSTTGQTTGTATGQASMTLDEAGDTWSGTGRISFFRPDGSLLDRTPSFPVRGTRIRHQPLE
jgi:hypothetical protein